jgi:hypothetical protein
METAGFWIVLTLSYLALSFLAGTRGVGYAERVDVTSRSIVFDLNPFLWLPDLFLHAYPPTNPVPYLVWWVALAAVIAETVMVLFRWVRGGPAKTTFNVDLGGSDTRKSRSPGP